MFIPNLLAAATEGREQNLWQTLIVIAIFFVFFYFILWRPEKKRRKKLENARSSLKTGDRVTAMGIIGTVEQINDDSIILKMFDGSKLEFVKASVTEVHSTVTVEETPAT
ncbi:MAG: hypothetical protein SP1CHLAM54_00210 [Chlamydiia bacterium]|nr:hypothetical protein [Chlamydiia bacterium]MCH9614943.1 hypothetical protein [Chlamydiia bacterium]MCH9630006.1 hypothetical protein [Chlamydiia bacterium]